MLIGQANSISTLEVLKVIGVPGMSDALGTMTGPVDVLLVGMAVFTGYWISFRRIQGTRVVEASAHGEESE